MKAAGVFITAATAVNAATWTPGAWDADTTTATGARMDPVVAAGQTTKCYKPFGSYMGMFAMHDPTCNATAGGVALSGPDCMWMSHRTSAVLGHFGAAVGADRQCCEDINSLATFFNNYAPGGSPSTKCLHSECANTTDNATVGFWKGANSDPDGSDWWSAPWKHHNGTSQAYPSNYHISQAAFAATSKRVFDDNGGVCWTKAKGHIVTKGFTTGHWSTNLTGISAAVQVPMYQGLYAIMQSRANTDMSPTSMLVQFTNEHKKCYNATAHPTTCGTSAAKWNVTAPDCVVEKGSDGSQSLMFSLGPKVGSQRHCCQSLKDALNMASYFQNENFTLPTCQSMDSNGMPDCTGTGVTGNSTIQYWLPAPLRSNASSGPFNYPTTNKMGLDIRIPKEGTWNTTWQAIIADDFKCLKDARAYMTANPTAAPLNNVGPMMFADAGLAPLLYPYWPTTTTTPAPTTAAATTAAATTAAATTGASSSSEGESTSAASSGSATAKIVTSAVTATETLPTGTTGADLLASTAYTTAKRDGIAAALGSGVAKTDVTITSYTIAARRMLEARKLSTADKTVTTNFEVAAADATAASAVTTSLNAASFKTDVKTQVVAKLAAADFSSDATFSANAPVFKTVSAVAAPTTAAAAPTTTKPAQKTSGAQGLVLSGAVGAVAVLALF